jgi:cytidine deaminase
MPQKINIQTQLTKYESLEALPAKDQELILKARKVTDNAYAPYSNFHVGAAILLESGEIILGTNQENAAYPSGLCAERTAIFWTGANRPNEKIVAIAIAAHPKNQDFVPVTPCGSCRQVLSEYEDKQTEPIKLIMQAEKGAFYVLDSVNILMPLKFSKDSLHL